MKLGIGMYLNHNLIPCSDAEFNFLVSARHFFSAKQQNAINIVSQVMYNGNTSFVTLKWEN